MLLAAARGLAAYFPNAVYFRSVDRFCLPSDGHMKGDKCSPTDSQMRYNFALFI